PAAQASKASGAASDRVRAQELLKQAESLVAEGRTEEARAKVQQAEKLDVAYEDALALTPDYLLAMIERAEHDGLLAQKGPASQDPSSKRTAAKKQEALTLTEEAEADLEAGRIEEAKVKAS